MNRYLHEELYSIPDLHLQLHRAASRARARAVHAAVAKGFAALARLGRRLKSHFDLRPSHWMERLG